MRRIVFSLMLLTGISVALLLVSHTSAVGGPPFSNRDLSGEYLFSLAEIRTEIGGTDYCDVAGTLSFDGIGEVIITSARRCSVTPPGPPAVLTLNYTVNPDGSFVIDASKPPDPPDQVHGQIVNRGRSLLIDGTLRSDPNLLMFHGVAMRR